MPAGLPEYEVFALRYATREAQRRDHFIGGDPHEAPMPMDYYVWAAVGPGGAYVIDTGFTGEMAKRAQAHIPALPHRQPGAAGRGGGRRAR